MGNSFISIDRKVNLLLYLNPKYIQLSTVTMEDSNERRILWVGNLSDSVTEDLLYELFLQAGPLESVKIPKDKSGAKRNFAFVTFKHEESVPYTIALMDNVCLFGRPLRLQTRVGAEIDSNPYLKKLHSHRRPSNSNNGTNPHYDKYSRQNSRHTHVGSERNHIAQIGHNSRYDRRYSQPSESVRTPERARGGRTSSCEEDKKSGVTDSLHNSPSDYQKSQNSCKQEVNPLSAMLSVPPPPLPQMPFSFGTNVQWNQQDPMRMFFFPNTCMPLSVANVSPFQQFGGSR